MHNHKLTRVLKALSDDNRRLILWSLHRRDLCVCELEALLAIKQPTVSSHLKLLADLELISAYRRGRWIFYRIATDTEEDINRLTQCVLSIMPVSPHYQSRLQKLPSACTDNTC